MERSDHGAPEPVLPGVVRSTQPPQPEPRPRAGDEAIVKRASPRVSISAAVSVVLVWLCPRERDEGIQGSVFTVLKRVDTATGQAAAYFLDADPTAIAIAPTGAIAWRDAQGTYVIDRPLGDSDPDGSDGLAQVRRRVAGAGTGLRFSPDARCTLAARSVRRCDSASAPGRRHRR